MPKQLSFTKDENQIVGGYRQKLNQAESTEDVRRCFTYKVSELFAKVFDRYKQIGTCFLTPKV